MQLEHKHYGPQYPPDIRQSQYNFEHPVLRQLHLVFFFIENTFYLFWTVPN